MRNTCKRLIPFWLLTLILTLQSCSSPKPVANANQTGESQESAIVVNSVEAEHRWINEHYPNARVLVQEVVQQAGKSFEVITIRTEAEERKTFYFDITRIKGKK